MTSFEFNKITSFDYTEIDSVSFKKIDNFQWFSDKIKKKQINICWCYFSAGICESRIKGWSS